MAEIKGRRQVEAVDSVLARLTQLADGLLTEMRRIDGKAANNANNHKIRADMSPQRFVITP